LKETTRLKPLRRVQAETLPVFAEARRLLGAGDSLAALGAVSALVERSQDGPTLALLGRFMLEELEAVPEALTCLQRASQRLPDDVGLHVDVGACPPLTGPQALVGQP
jgi:hypothetical protein